jgi:hypothetical protein
MRRRERNERYLANAPPTDWNPTKAKPGADHQMPITYLLVSVIKLCPMTRGVSCDDPKIADLSTVSVATYLQSHRSLFIEEEVRLMRK